MYRKGDLVDGPGWIEDSGNITVEVSLDGVLYLRGFYNIRKKVIDYYPQELATPRNACFLLTKRGRPKAGESIV